MTVEVNFDGLVGPTHHFGGYAYGNIASMEHRKQVSHPRQAALEGLNKMKLLLDLGIPQAVLPPRMRPSFAALRSLGFTGSDEHIFQSAAKSSPSLFYQLCSSSFMWAANCATFSPSIDTQDGRAHITVANLQSHFHRSIESEETYRLLRLLFNDEGYFAVHPALPKGGDFGDEGAANHTRFCLDYGDKGIHLFIYGKSAFEAKSARFPFRQAQEASEAVARCHGLDPDTTFFVMQNPRVIEEGVFHNDVISVGNKNLFFYHEKAFIDTEAILNKIQEKCPLKTVCITEEMIPVKTAVQTYLFNGQLLTLPDGKDLLLLPKECLNLDLEWLPFKIAYVDLTESMHNGGGPACLRLRCVLNEKEIKRVHPSIFLTETLYRTLVNWVEKYFREDLSLLDLADPDLLLESQEALDTLTQILHLGSFYEFQRAAPSSA